LYISENWVIHFEQNVLDGLAEWHQKTFADKNGGGNGLFADVLKSTFTNDEVEEQLLDAQTALSRG
jgi:oligoribonuclease (3'-5' exoribonuclease)